MLINTSTSYNSEINFNFKISAFIFHWFLQIIKKLEDSRVCFSLKLNLYLPMILFA